jgi:hypothetical protein
MNVKRINISMLPAEHLKLKTMATAKKLSLSKLITKTLLNDEK